MSEASAMTSILRVHSLRLRRRELALLRAASAVRTARSLAERAVQAHVLAGQARVEGRAAAAKAPLSAVHIGSWLDALADAEEAARRARDKVAAQCDEAEATLRDSMRAHALAETRVAILAARVRLQRMRTRDRIDETEAEERIRPQADAALLRSPDGGRQ